MSKLFCINEEERGVGKSFQLARFCVAKTLLGDIDNLIVLALTFRQSKIVLRHVDQILNEIKIFHTMDVEVDNIFIVINDKVICCVPINTYKEHSHSGSAIVLDEHLSIPHDIMEALLLKYGPLVDIREHNLFELLNQHEEWKQHVNI